MENDRFCACFAGFSLDCYVKPLKWVTNAEVDALWTGLSGFKRLYVAACWFLFLAGSRWLAVRLDGICALFIGTVAFGSVFTASFLDVDAGQVGLTLSYSIIMMGMFQWGVRQSTEVENLVRALVVTCCFGFP